MGRMLWPETGAGAICGRVRSRTWQLGKRVEQSRTRSSLSPPSHLSTQAAGEDIQEKVRIQGLAEGCCAARCKSGRWSLLRAGDESQLPGVNPSSLGLTPSSLGKKVPQSHVLQLQCATKALEML